MLRAVAATAALLGFTGVALGAFGAHGLQGHVDERMLEAWKTGVSYQLFHTPVILMLACLPCFQGKAPARVAGWCLIAGVVLFSGSLYLLVALDMPRLGMITPIGGSLLLLGWLALGIAAVTRSR